ncbi:hypothetical protein [Phyllobacterium meliloti]|uniref:hypothetical protein n=1 Tax=Phyllobacterium meliloti TaxID=555317 RepID=UPI001D158BDC|nr:hypothetical protein [Phyllobacterium sp. T1293]UGX89160.1 hypothetical protein LLE53_024110 [Phyllobacterium sp. T1293]
MAALNQPTKLAAPVLLDHLLKVVDQRLCDDDVRKMLSIAAMSTAYDLDRLSRASLIGLAMFRAEDVRACILDQALSKAPAPHLFKDDADLTTKVFLTHFAPECRSIARALALVVVKPG